MTGPIVIAGVGSIGRRHLENLATLGWSELVLYRTGRSTVDVPGGFEVESLLDDALARRPTAVVVSNPTSLHLPTALAAARAGAHLLVEKPVSHTSAGVEELESEVERRGLVVLVGYHYRHHPTLRRVRDWIADGAIGDVVTAAARWGEYLPGWHPWEDYRTGYSARRDLGGGVVLTLSHPLDYLAWLLGPVARVTARTGRRSGLELDVEDTAHLVLEHEGGALATVVLDYVRRPPAHGLEVVGTTGAIEWDAESGVARLLRPDAGPTEAGPPPGFERNDLFLEEMRHFLACITGAESPACTLADGVHALRVAEAALRSEREGRTVYV